MDRPPFFAFYPADFANDINVEAMSTLQVGAYMLLLCKAWQADPPASLPDDDQVLARFARVDAVTWQEIKLGVLVPWRLGTDRRLHNKRLRQEYDKALKLMRAKQEAGKKAASVRWGSAQTDNRRIATAVTDALPSHSDRNAIQIENKTEEINTPPTPAKPGVCRDEYPSIPATGEEEDPGKEKTRTAPKLAQFAEENEPDFDPCDHSGIVPIVPWSELIREWTEAKLPGYQTGVSRTRYRLEMWQKRQAESRDWRKKWREAVRRAGRSKCCRAEDPKFLVAGLRLDTFLREETMVFRILEGEFDGNVDRPAVVLDQNAAREKELLKQHKLGTITAEETEQRLGRPLAPHERKSA